MSEKLTFRDRSLPHVHIYCDGSCEPNPGIAGWGAVLIHVDSGKRREASGYIGEATNNIAELTAAIEALKLLTKPCWVELHSDSRWLINCADGTWRAKEHKHLWATLGEVAQPHLIQWTWVKGHDNHIENERSHQLANIGRMRRAS